MVTKGEFINIWKSNYPQNKLEIVKTVKDVSGLMLKESKELVDDNWNYYSAERVYNLATKNKISKEAKGKSNYAIDSFSYFNIDKAKSHKIEFIFHKNITSIEIDELLEKIVERIVELKNNI